MRLAASVLARAAKADRLRQAKQEAEREVKAYKAQREEQYQKRIADVRGPQLLGRSSDISCLFCVKHKQQVSHVKFPLFLAFWEA